ncbi:MAG: TOBE domain-containing protein, partial [Hyphomicrobiales bacterium]
MRAELKRLHQELGISFLLVTHDQEDALSLSDRIGVMKQGQICQIGVPRDIYFNPINKFVAEFMGSTNAISGQLLEEARNNWVFVTDFGPWALQEAPAERRQTEQCLFLRPEDIELSRKPENDPAWSGIVKVVEFMGHRQFATVALTNGELTAQIGPKDELDVGDEVFVGLPASPKFLDQSTDALRIQKVTDVD